MASVDLVLAGFLALVCSQSAQAMPVTLQQGTATFSQLIFGGPFGPNQAVDGNFASTNGWSVGVTDIGDGASAQTAVWETAVDLGAGTFTFNLYFFHFNDEHLLGRFRLSVTTDDRSTFADGLYSGGDVDANWIVLSAPTVTGPAGMTFTTLSDQSILAGGTTAAQGIYTLTYSTTVSGITGIRLETLEDPSLPFNGPGLDSLNGNFFLTEITLDYTAVCGNGVVEFGEQCDLPGSNGSVDSCCSSTCQYRAAGSICRPAAGACDLPEACTGSASICPADQYPTCTPTATPTFSPISNSTVTPATTPIPTWTPTDSPTVTPTQVATDTPTSSPPLGSTATPSPISFGTPTSTSAAPQVQLLQGTATFSQLIFGGPFGPDQAVDGNFASTNGWSVGVTDIGDGASAQTAVWETAADLGAGTLTFKLYFFHFNDEHLLGRFRLSVTTDDRSTFADGLYAGGDVDANWIVLTNPTVSGPSSMTFTTLPDDSILAGGTTAPQGVYTVTYTTTVSGITGIRLETLEDPSLPFNGPGLDSLNGNFFLTEITLDYAPGCGNGPTCTPIATPTATPTANTPTHTPTSISTAVPVRLQQGTATFSQLIFGGPFGPDQAVDGNFASTNGWSVGVTDIGDGASAQTAVWETATDIGPGALTFTLYFFHFNDEHLLGRFRLSMTTDDRSTFADGLYSGGDVDANWIVLTDPAVTGPAGMTFTTLPDQSILAGGTTAAQGIYTLTYSTTVSGITGIRLEALEDPSLPFSGPGLDSLNGNFFLTELTLDYTPAPESVTGQVDAGGTLTTDTEGDGATSADPVETSVTSPNAGTVSINESAASGSPSTSLTFAGQEVHISAPPATAGNPLVLVFLIDASRIPDGVDQNSIQMFKDAVLVPECAGPPGVAAPDPCVSNRRLLSDGDIEMTVLTSTASVWTFAVPCSGTVVDPKLILRKLNTPPGDDKLTLQGGVTLPFPFNPPLNPLVTGVRLLIDHTGGNVLDVTIPSGTFVDPPGVGWKVRGSKWTYLNNAVMPPGGIVKLVIQDASAWTPGLVKFRATGRAGAYPVPAANLPVTVRIVLSPPVTNCGAASFGGPAPSPVCAFNKAGSTLTCK